MLIPNIFPVLALFKFKIFIIISFINKYIVHKHMYLIIHYLINDKYIN